MTTPTLTHVLIIEPKVSVSVPYQYLQATSIVRVTSVEAALISMDTKIPDLVVISASFPDKEMFRFFDALKTLCSTHLAKLIPILVVINLREPISTIFGTTWGKKLGIATSESSQAEFEATLARITLG
jgi:PleD family two-component response regulator